MELDWIWVWLTNCSTSLVCYFFARSAAKMRIQPLGYALPLVLCTPIMFGLMIGGCEWSNWNPCAIVTGELAGYLTYKCYGVGEIREACMQQWWFMMPVWWLSQLWIVWHIWFPKSERLAKSEKLVSLHITSFLYCLIDKSVLNNHVRPARKTKLSYI